MKEGLEKDRTEAGPRVPDVGQFLEQYIATRASKKSQKHYQKRLNKFARWLGEADRVQGLQHFLGLGPEIANVKARQYRASLEGQGRSRTVIGSLIAPVRGFTVFCRKAGAISWQVTFAQCGQARPAFRDLVKDEPAPKNKLEAKAAELIELLGVQRPNANTRKAYLQAFRGFGQFTRAKTLPEGLAGLLKASRGEANRLTLGYVSAMQRAGLSPATMAQRIQALRSFVRIAYDTEVIEWTLSVRAPHVESYADVRGPGRDKVLRALRDLEARTDPRGLRDHALVWMLYGMALRASEVLGLDLEHVNLVEARGLIHGKGRLKREPVTIPPPAIEALKSWLAVRGLQPGPLFIGFHGRGGGRLRRETLWRITTALGLGRPHGLRHSAITQALNLLNGDVRKVRLFSRHRDVNTLIRYDDLRIDAGGDVARLVAADAEGTAVPVKSGAVAE